MNLKHEFLNRVKDVTLLFPCLSLEDFLEGLQSLYSPVSYGSKSEYMMDGFALFSEAYFKYFSEKYGISEIDRVHSKTVDFIGKSSENFPVSIYPLLLDEDREITINKDGLTHFAENSFEHFGVLKPEDMIVLTNGKKVNETIMAEAPAVRNFRYVFLDEIDTNTKDNIEFWLTFRKAVEREKDVIYSSSHYEVRDFQVECVSRMLYEDKGKIVLPPGCGKSVIAADYILKTIQNSEEDTPVFLVLSPRIILSYQLLNVVFSHLTNNKISAQYCNLCSGNMDKVAVEMYERMKKEGLLVTPIETSMSVYQIKDHLKRAKEQKIPIIVSGTYHTGWQMIELGEVIHTVAYDECHNLIMGRFSEDFKEECLQVPSKKKFFFTATPCNTASEKGRGMNNTDTFGDIIYTKSHYEMIEKREILPVRLHTIGVDDYLILKNKDEEISDDNIKDADFDRDCTVKARAIVECHKFHEAVVKKHSASGGKIGGKIIVTINGLPTLRGILKSKEIEEFIKGGKHVFAISTAIKYWHNGIQYSSADFKEKFLKDTNNLDDEESAIILHIDMLGEGLDNRGITGVMAFSVMGIQKTIQLIGRAQRLHAVDREKLYAGLLPTNVPRESVMIKPYGYFMVPIFLRDSNDIRDEARKFLDQIHNELGFIPEMIYSNSKDPGDNENLTNNDFKSMYEKYEVLDFVQEIEELKKQEMLDKIKSDAANEAFVAAEALAKSLGIML